MHKLALMQSEVQILRQANEELSKRRRAKRHVYGKVDHLVNRKHKICKMRGTLCSR
jgi:hypothetical protein